MKGTNRMVLNQETMVEAVQYWLNSRIVGETPKVISVNRPDYQNDFEIVLLSPSAPEVL